MWVDPFAGLLEVVDGSLDILRNVEGSRSAFQVEQSSQSFLLSSQVPKHKHPDSVVHHRKQPRMRTACKS